MPTEKPKNAFSTFRRLCGIYMSELPALILVLLFVLLSSGLSLAAPYLIGQSIDLISSDKFVLILLLIIAAYIINWLTDFLRDYLMAAVTQRLVKRMRDALFKKLGSLPLKYFDLNAHGDIMSRISNDIDNISTTIAQSTTQLMSSLIMIFGTLVIMLLLNPILTVASLITVPLVFLVSKSITSRTREYFRRQQRLLGQANGIIEENVTGLALVKAFNRESFEQSRFDEVNEELRNVSVKAQIWAGTMMPLMNVINNIGFASITITGGILALNSMVTPGIISSFLSYSRQFTRPLNEIASMLNSIQSALAGAERVFETMDEAEEKPDLPDAKPLCDIKGDISFENVCFSYTEGVPILKNVSFNIRAGSVVALVGPTGAGKTTIVNLLTRAYDADSGVIRIDGVDITHYTRRSLRENFSVVLQDMTLFTGSVTDNIRYGRLNATDEEVKSAARAVGAESFILRLPNGYDTQVTADGDALSAGQRQLIAIARAALSNAKLLVLDEATSNVDTRTEQIIQKSMLDLTKSKTCFIIAHRLSTIRDSDLIIVVKDGKIAQSGNHAQLMSQDGLYRQMTRTIEGEY